eukprot:366472-Chlamydomonas_euryale.AAC.18
MTTTAGVNSNISLSEKSVLLRLWQRRHWRWGILCTCGSTWFHTVLSLKIGMPKFGGSFPSRHFKGAENILLPKCSAFFAYRSFPCYLCSR